MTTAANAAVGRSWRRFGATSRRAAMASALTTLVSWVRAPAASATGVRELLLLIEKPWKKPVARLAAPSPIISWLGSTGYPKRAAYARESTLVSANDISAIAQPPVSTGRISL